MADLAYVATAPCGCAHDVDLGDGPETHAQIAEWLKRDSTVRRMSWAEAKVLLVHDCQHEPKWGRNA